MFRKTRSRKGVPEPPPPGQLTDPDYDEVSLVPAMANGEMFYVRKGESLTPEKIEELKQAGLTAPKSLADVVKECIESILPETLKQMINKGEVMQTKTGTQKSEQAPQPVQRELETQEIEQIREIAQEVAGALFDERFTTIQEQIDEIKTSMQSTTESQTEMQKSIDSVKSTVTAVQGDVQKSLDFRPTGQGNGERGETPTDPEELANIEFNKAWGEFFIPKKGA